MREFNVQLPPSFKFIEGTQEEKEKQLEDYLFRVVNVLEESFFRLFRRVTETADSPTDGHLASLDEDGQIEDSGIDKDELATKSYVAEAIEAALEAQKLNEHADPDGSVEFAKQQALQFVIENRTSDPDSPVTGQIWFRTDV